MATLQPTENTASLSGSVAKPERWDVPFWQESVGRRPCKPMTDEVVADIGDKSPFKEIDPDRFPKSMPLDGILQNDARVRRFAKGELVVRQGDYGNSAFFVLSGTVRVLLDQVDEKLLGRRDTKRKSFWSAMAQLWNNPTTPELRHYGEGDPQSGKAGVTESTDAIDAVTTVFLQDVPTVINTERSREIQVGDLFGEIAALTRTPRTATIVADSRCDLLEIRWQGLRELRRRSPELRDHIDQLYRERALQAHLDATPMFAHVDPDGRKEVADATEFQTFGDYEWHTSYKKVRDMKPGKRLRYEPLVAQEGHYPNGVYLIRSGFARVSERYNHGERTVSYLGRGQVFGFDEIAYNFIHQKSVPFQRTLRGLGHVDVLFIPTSVIEKYVLPNVDPDSIPNLEANEDDLDPASGSAPLSANLLEFLVEQRFINGTATMMIDMDRCTRCDDCVRACASAHQNNPRFIRHGPIHERFMIAHACLHCQDPVCMIGCPTGAIHRTSAGGQVVINDLTCIGCATCANSCPYDNIQVVPVRDGSGQVVRDLVSNKPIEKATKCDLCVDQLTGPACVNSCPHDAMARVDMRDLESVAKWLQR
ncbi:MAG: cyclic nucleotide-binding domain-containing protein [Limisphaerales bacterium]